MCGSGWGDGFYSSGEEVEVVDLVVLFIFLSEAVQTVCCSDGWKGSVAMRLAFL